LSQTTKDTDYLLHAGVYASINTSHHGRTSKIH